MNLVVLHLAPTLEGGGAERQLSMLAAEQSRRGLVVHVAVRRGGTYEETLRQAGVNVHVLGNYKSLHPLLFLKVDFLMKRIKPNVVQTWLPQMDIVGGVISLKNSVPWLLSERTSRLAFKEFIGLDWVRCRLGRKAKAVVANSGGGVAYWRAKLDARALIERIPNAVDVKAIRAATLKPDRQTSSVRQILVVGRLAPEKCLDIVVRAVSLVPDSYDIHVSFIGDGPLRHSLQNAISAAGLDRRCSILPFQKDWWGLLQNAQALVSMSCYEGQPNVVLEAMASGCPLIVSAIPAHLEILDSDSAILVPSHDPVDLAHAISTLLGDPGGAQRRAHEAAKRVLGLSIDVAADAYESLYKNVLPECERCAE